MLGTTALDSKSKGLANHSKMLLFIIGSKSREGSTWLTMAKPPCRCKEESAGAEEGCITERCSEKRASYSLGMMGGGRNFRAILECCITDSTP